MEINKENARYFLEKVGLFLNSIFPGVVMLEIFFHQGLFSKTPGTLFSFILYILWCMVLSIPFHYILPFSLEGFMKKMFMFYAKKENLSEETIKKMGEFEDEETKNLENEVLFGFVCIRITLIYFIYKIIIYSGFIKSTFLNISLNNLHFGVSFCIGYLLSFPVGNLYSRIVFFIFNRYINHSNK